MLGLGLRVYDSTLALCNPLPLIHTPAPLTPAHMQTPQYSTILFFRGVYITKG